MRLGASAARRLGGSLVMAAAVGCASATSAALPGAQQGALAITDVAVVDVRSGAVEQGQTVVIDGGRIVAVGAAESTAIPPGAGVVGGTGRYLIPGLWDMHTHTLNRWRWAFPLHVANGVTGIRDLSTSTPMAELRQLELDVAAGAVVGPRFITAGPLIDGPESVHRYVTIRTADEGRRVVDSLHAEGVDFVKVYEELSPEAFFAVVEAARGHGLAVAGHVPFSVPAEDALAVLTSVEHSHTLRGRCIGPAAMAAIDATWPEVRAARERNDGAALAALDHQADSIERVSYAAERCAAGLPDSLWITPTLTLHIQSFALPALISPDSLFANPEFRYVPKEWLERWRTLRARESAADAARGPAAAAAWHEAEIRRWLAVAGDAHRGGAKLLAGTDGSWQFQVFGFNLHDELGWLVRAGLTPLEALQAATLSPARYLGRERDIGTVEPGKLADLVLLNANPLDDIANSRRIRAVILNGKLLTRADLDRLLAEVAAMHGP